MLAIYSLAELAILKKFRFSQVSGSQDDGFCFSPDGKYLLNTEPHSDSLHTRLTVYDTAIFAVVKQLFTAQDAPVLSHIEYDKECKAYFVLGFMRNDSGEYHFGFIAELVGEALAGMKQLTAAEYEWIDGYKNLERMGFTAKAKEWSSLKYRGYDVANIEAPTVRLADYSK